MKQLNWYQIFGQTHTIPDGSTVTPTDDIQIWLNCANIWDKTYTTLLEVLADTDTLLALISSNNAVDYMVRSTTWAVGSALVPTMTSQTTPSGECSQSSYYTSGQGPHYAYKVFDGDPTTYWNSAANQTSNQWISYKFPSVTNVAEVKVTNKNDTGAYAPNNCKVQKSSDGVTWTDISDSSFVGSNVDGATVKHAFPNTDSTYFRLYMTDGYKSQYIMVGALQFYSASITADATAMTYIGQNNYCANTLLADATWCNAICNSEYFESVLNVKVPKMTSNTTPSGKCSQYGTAYSAAYDAYKAFDGDSSTSAQAQFTRGETGYVRYEFPSAVKCFMGRYVAINPSSSSITFDFQLQRSADAANWVNISEVVTKNLSAGGRYDSDNVIFISFETVKYYRLNIYPNNYYAAGAVEVQFYGREDV